MLVDMTMISTPKKIDIAGMPMDKKRKMSMTTALAINRSVRHVVLPMISQESRMSFSLSRLDSSGSVTHIGSFIEWRLKMSDHQRQGSVVYGTIEIASVYTLS